MDKPGKQIEKECVIRNKLGLHARPAALFVQTANRYGSEVVVIRGDESVNGKSIMGIMTLAVQQGTPITIRVTGLDAEDALKALEELIESDFGEQ